MARRSLWPGKSDARQQRSARPQRAAGQRRQSATFWQAAAGDTNAWWQTDLERIVDCPKDRLIFPAEGDWRYKIEISVDGSQWKLAVDQTNGTATAKDRTATVPPGMIARFVRITFTGLPPDTAAALTEAQFTGHSASHEQTQTASIKSSSK